MNFYDVPVYNSNPNPNEFAQFVGTDLWIFAYIDSMFDVNRYINILHVDNQYVTYVGIDIMLMDYYIFSGEPISNSEFEDMSQALYVSENFSVKGLLTDDPNHYRRYGIYKVPLDAVTLCPEKLYTTAELQEILNNCTWEFL